MYFAAGAYDPESEAGVELIAHEVAHVAQQARGRAGAGGVSRADDAHEVEAEDLAKRFLVQRRRPARGTERGDQRAPSETATGSETAPGSASGMGTGSESGTGTASALASGTVSESGSSSSTSSSRRFVDAQDDWWGGARAPTPIESAPVSPVSPVSPVAATAPSDALAIDRKKAEEKKATAAPLSTVVELLGKSEFDPGAEVAKHIEQAGKQGAQVRVKLGKLTGGDAILLVRKQGKHFVTVEDKPQLVRMAHPLLVPLQGFSPVIRVRIGHAGPSAITGYVAPEAAAGNAGAALAKALAAAPEVLGLVGFEVPKLALTNKLEHGRLELSTQKAAKFELGGWVDGELTLALHDDAVTFDATAHLKARGLKDSSISITRDDKGKLRGEASLALDLGEKFSGSATAKYEHGDLTIKGELGYHSEKFNGKVGLIVAEAAQAEQLVRAQIDPAGVLAAMPAGSEANSAGGKKPAASSRLKKGERAIAGWGELDFAFTDWLTGKALVAYGPTGHLTVMGKIAAPKRLDLMKEPIGGKYPILPEVKIEASYGLPYVADIHVGIGVSLNASAHLGPIYMTDLAVEGVYSTDPTVCNAFSISGALRAQADAGVELDVKGYAGLRILKHSINVGAGITGKAGVKAYAEARPTLGYREVANPTAGKRGEYYLKGHLEMAAQPVLELGGYLFVELDSPWWSPAPNKTWRWPIGELEYPLPTSLGVGADVDYVVGSGNWPKLNFTQPSFDASKFVDTMMDDNLPKKSGAAGSKEKAGSWKGAPVTAPTAPPPTVAKTPVAEPKAKAGTPDRKPKKGGKQSADEQKNVPKTQDAAQRWSAGLEALGELRKRSERDPETGAEIKQHLAELKARHGFTQLTADRSGDKWLVDAAMNPSRRDIPIHADPREPANGANGANAAAPGAAFTGLSPALAAAATQPYPRRKDLEAKCRQLAAQHGAKVRISNAKRSGVSETVFTESTPPAGQRPRRLVARIEAVGKTDAELEARAGAGNTRELGVSKRGSSERDTAMVNVGPASMAQNPDFEKAAGAFEDKLGALAWRHPAAIQGADDLAKKAKAYLQRKVGGQWDAANTQLAALCERIGSDKPSWSGAVGTEVRAVMKCFDSGNIAEKMNHVGAFFVKVLGSDLTNPALLQGQLAELKTRMAESGLHVKTLLTRRKEIEEKQRRNQAVSGWDVAPTAKGSAAEGQWHARADRADAMGVPRQDASGADNEAGRGAVARSSRTLAETGVTLGEGEAAMQRRGDPSWDVERDAIKWEEGVKVWIMNERDKWVQWQRQLSVPVGAGPSGTTNQLMQAAKAFQVERYSARAACIAYLLPSHHHTLVEILAAAAPFNCAYTPGQRMYRKLQPFSKEELLSCGKDGKFPDEIAGDAQAHDGAVTLVMPPAGAGS